jgi:phage-related tail fiber protein
MPKKMLTGIDLANQRAINLADGSAATDAVTLQQLQAAIRGLDWKASVRAATTANLTLSGTQTVDGVALVAGDRVLVKDQTTSTANGIYVVAAGAWARAVDADENLEVTSGLAVTVETGTVNGDRVYVLVTDGTIVVGTTGLTFTQLGGGGASYTAGNGLSLSGSTFAVAPKASGGIVVDSTGVSVDTALIARKYATAIGDGTATAYTVTHNLGTRDVDVSIQSASTFEIVEADVVAATATTVTVTFATAPTTGQYRVVVIG